MFDVHEAKRCTARRVRALWLIAACAGVLATTPAPAIAQPARKPPAKTEPKSSEAKALFDEGAELYTRGSYEEAITAWEKSYELSKKPLIFESIANAYERLGQPKKAREYLARWRAVAPEDEHDLLDARIKKLDERIARDDQAEQARQAQEDKLRSERAAEEERRRQQEAQRAGGDDDADLMGPGLALAAAGVGAVAVGVTLDIIAYNRRPDEGAVCAPVGDEQFCQESASDSIESSNTLALVGDIIWIVGAVAVAGGVTLILLDPPDKEDKTSTTLTPSFGPRGGALRFAKTF
jgi:tetratricopeptide (TPR) repeat protein